MVKGFKDDKGKFHPTGNAKPPTNFNFNNDDDDDERTIEELLNAVIDERIGIRAKQLLKEKQELERPIIEVILKDPNIPEIEKQRDKSFKKSGLSELEKFDYQGGHDRGSTFANTVTQIAPSFTIGSKASDDFLRSELKLFEIEPEELSIGVIRNKEDAMRLLKEVAMIFERGERSREKEKLDGETQDQEENSPGPDDNTTPKQTESEPKPKVEEILELKEPKVIIKEVPQDNSNKPKVEFKQFNGQLLPFAKRYNI